MGYNTGGGGGAGTDDQNSTEVPHVATGWTAGDNVGAQLDEIVANGPKNKFDATADPGPTNDETENYSKGSRWLNTVSGILFYCSVSTTGNAEWVSAGQVVVDSVAPTSSNDETEGYFVGSVWFHISGGVVVMYVCTDASTGAAVWYAETKTHVDDATGAHASTAISHTATGYTSGANVGAQLDEIVANGPKNNYGAGGAPTVNDDVNSGYSVGSKWTFGANFYICISATAGAADWRRYAQATELNSYLPLAGGTMSGDIDFDDAVGIVNLAHIEIPKPTSNPTAGTHDGNLVAVETIEGSGNHLQRLIVKTPVAEGGSSWAEYPDMKGSSVASRVNFTGDGAFRFPTVAATPASTGDTREQSGYLERYDGTSWQKVAALVNKHDATTDPGPTNDSSEGYVVGSEWTNVSADKTFKCTDATVDNANWEQTNAAGGGGASLLGPFGYSAALNITDGNWYGNLASGFPDKNSTHNQSYGAATINGGSPTLPTANNGRVGVPVPVSGKLKGITLFFSDSTGDTDVWVCGMVNTHQHGGVEGAGGSNTTKFFLDPQLCLDAAVDTIDGSSRTHSASSDAGGPGRTLTLETDTDADVEVGDTILLLFAIDFTAAEDYAAKFHVDFWIQPD